MDLNRKGREKKSLWESQGQFLTILNIPSRDSLYIFRSVEDLVLYNIGTFMANLLLIIEYSCPGIKCICDSMRYYIPHS